MIYRLFLWPLLRFLDPERAHTLAVRTLQAVQGFPGALRTLRALLRQPDPVLQVKALGLTFTSPLGVAAGVDKDARCFDALGALGFGSVEVGTVTAVAQPGNDRRPRVFRLLGDRALLNTMGFPSEGAEQMAKRLRRRRSSRQAQQTIVGVNVGKSKDEPLEHAADDYRTSVKQVAPFCDYLAINVSSPNTPGLRELQAPDLLRPIVEAIRSDLSKAQIELPILIKISPDLANAQLDELANLALELSLDGIVAVNTTLDRSGVDCTKIIDVEGGGISGAPLSQRSLEVLKRLYAHVGTKLVLVSVGGVETAEDAWERILAGATLVQGHTGFVYNGPRWPSHINRGLAQRVRAAGGHSIQDFVGMAASRSPSSLNDICVS